MANQLNVQLQNESLIAFSEVPNCLPKRNGKKTHYATVYRWALKGARGKILESILVGGVRYTSREALHRFLNGKSPIARRSDYETTLDRILNEKGK